MAAIQEIKPASNVDVEHLDESTPVPLTGMTPNEAQEAYQGALAEHRLPFRQGLVIYKKALFWAFVMSTTLVMEAYDNHLLGNFFSLPAFQDQFGERVKGKTVKYEISAAWQSGLSMSKLVGIIIGCEANKWLVDRWGYRRVTLGSIFFMTVFIFPFFFAQNLATILVAEMIFSIPFGVVSVLVQAYSMELLPLSLRHLGPNVFSFMRGIGALVAAGILQGMVGITGEWAWKIPVAIQWVWPVPLTILIWFAPESPWWLVRKGKMDAALQTLDRLSTSEANNEEALAVIVHTVSLEKTLHLGGRFIDCFRGTNLRRTEIEVAVRMWNAIATFGLQTGTFFFENAGFSPKHAFALNTGASALGAAATFCTAFILSRVGRRRLWLCGFTGCCTCVGIVGILATQPNQSNGVVWAQGIVLMIHNVIISLTSDPLSCILGTEIASVELRQKTLSLSANVSNVWQIVTHFVSPYLINANEANLGGKAAWVPCGVDMIILLWSYYRLPETKGRSIEELDYLFAQRIPARGFMGHVIPDEVLYAEKDQGAKEKTGLEVVAPGATLEA